MQIGHKHIYAIDPDVTASGLAILNRDTRELSLFTKPFCSLLETLKRIRAMHENNREPYIVLVEDSWTHKKGNWHINKYKSHSHAAALGENVGRCHQVGILLLEFCKYNGINAIGVNPLPIRVAGKPLWKGRDGKITADEFKQVTGYSKRSNQEERDAGLIAWSHACLPIKTESIKMRRCVRKTTR